MFRRVYSDPVAKHEEVKAVHLVQELFRYYLEHAQELPQDYLRMIREKGQDREQVVCDYIAGMTDPYSIKIYNELFIPQGWKD